MVTFVIPIQLKLKPFYQVPLSVARVTASKFNLYCSHRLVAMNFSLIKYVQRQLPQYLSQKQLLYQANLQ